MALSKTLTDIMQRLERIEAKLDAAVPKPLPPKSPPDPAQQAAAFAASIDYDSYSVREIAERAGSLTPQQRAWLRGYEQAHKNRSGAIAALEERD